MYLSSTMRRHVYASASRRLVRSPTLRAVRAFLATLAVGASTLAWAGEFGSLTIAVPHTVRRVSINGDLSEWDSAAAIEFRAPHQRGGRDNSTSVKLQWDNGKLYVAFLVRDTELRAGLVGDDQDLWRDDAVEVLLDTKHDGAEILRLSDEEYSRRGGEFNKFEERVFKDDNDYQIIANLRSTVLTSRGAGLEHNDRTWDADIPCGIVARGTINDAADVDSGYVVELAIPWIVIGVRPRAGLVMGADFGIEDVDADGRHPSDWCSLEYFIQPHQWGDMVLEGAVAPRGGSQAVKLILVLFAAAAAVVGMAVVVRQKREGNTPRTQSDARADAIAAEVEKQVAQNYASAEFSTAQVAASLWVSERYLQIALRKAGMPRFREMLNRYRIEKAKVLLQDAAHNVGEVGYAVGFNRPDVFSATFKKYAGVRPREFRRRA